MNKLLILTWLAVAAQGAKAGTIPELVAQAKPAVIQVIAFDKQWKPIKNGTGFFISPDGYAVTNFHVVSGAANVMARTNTGAFFPYEGPVGDTTKAGREGTTPWMVSRESQSWIRSTILRKPL